MGDTLEIIYQDMAYYDYLLIAHIKEMRDKKGLTQLQLSQKMKLSDGFVSKVETLTERAKYSIRHLPLLAKSLDCNIEELLPKDEFRYDKVILTIHRSAKRNKDGSISKKKESKVVHIEPTS